MVIPLEPDGALGGLVRRSGALAGQIGTRPFRHLSPHTAEVVGSHLAATKSVRTTTSDGEHNTFIETEWILSSAICRLNRMPRRTTKPHIVDGRRSVLAKTTEGRAVLILNGKAESTISISRP